MATVTRTDLSDAVLGELRVPRREAAELVDTVIKAIAERLEAGEAVRVSSFGSFTLRDKGSRIGRNPKTGEAVPILPRRAVVFRASRILKGRIDEEDAQGRGARLGRNGPATLYNCSQLRVG